MIKLFEHEDDDALFLTSVTTFNAGSDDGLSSAQDVNPIKQKQTMYLVS